MGRNQLLGIIKNIVVTWFWVLVFASVDTPLNAEGENYALSKRDFVFALHFQDKTCGWCVGNKGLLLKTVSAGDNWQKVPTNTENALNDVTFVGENGWVVGQGGTVLHTEDGGLTWTTQDTDTSLSLMQVCFTDSIRGFIVGEGGTVLSTSDGGATWSSLDLDWLSLLPQELIEIGVVVANLYDISFIDTEHGWIVGDNGIVLSTRDAGKTWRLLRAGQLPPLFSVTFKTLTDGWATGQDGLLLVTHDGGERWEPIELPVRASLFRIRMKNACGILVGNGGTVLRTSNGGITWDKIKLDLSLPYPWFGDAWILGEEHSSTEIILVGKAEIRKLPCLDK